MCPAEKYCPHYQMHGLTLDTSGFELISHRGTLTDWASFKDADRVKAIDYPEIEAALKARTGVDKVVIFDHTLRDATATPGRAELREPVRRVHDDQTLIRRPGALQGTWHRKRPRGACSAALRSSISGGRSGDPCCRHRWRCATRAASNQPT
jgi:hypothetical protein